MAHPLTATGPAVAVLLASLLQAGCGGLSDAEAIRVVETYNQRVITAYRQTDPTLVEAVASADEARKITGLIGVKVDQGIYLDATLTEFEVLGVDRLSGSSERRVEVSTRERWDYLDRSLESDEQVGEASTDSYRMTYVLRDLGAGWRVAEIRFAEPPEVGRTEVPNQGSVQTLHGIPQPMPED